MKGDEVVGEVGVYVQVSGRLNQVKSKQASKVRDNFSRKLCDSRVEQSRVK